jgi:hypothetical protein
VAVNLLARQRVAVAANTMLYRRTILKLPSHSIRPKSPRRSKFVIPVIRTNYSISFEIFMLMVVEIPRFRIEKQCRLVGRYLSSRGTWCINLQAIPVSTHFYSEDGCTKYL